MTRSSYHIADEPRPSRLASMAVDPVWPLFGHMFGGILVAWPWFALNALAVGSPTRKRELVMIALGWVMVAVLVAALLALLGAEILPEGAGPYLVIVLTVFKLGVSYTIFMLQYRTFELFRYFGGSVRNGLPLVFISALAVPRILGGNILLLLFLR